MFTQCAFNQEDIGIADKERPGATKPRLIDSFRFLDRSFNDIGDDVYINPEVFHNMITKNSNASFFDIVNKVLSDNNFNFIPLPTFVNFNKPKELSDIFTPYPWNDSIISGPSFVCVYAGQSSSNLNLGDNANYADDGIFISVDINGDPIGIPEDLNNRKTISVYETNLPVFTVNYGQQNQNYFKDVKLDQKEFSETAESLEIIDEISNNADKDKPIMVGQNLFNVYQKRSYSCEVEMLGCALIQPMMYFQLNNIPMFRGLYLIIKVSHTIKPNSMTTTFKGVRVKRAKTPLLTASDVLMTLVGDIKNSKKSASINGTSVVGTESANASSETVATVKAKLDAYIDNHPIGRIIEGNLVSRQKILIASNTAIDEWAKGTIKEENNVNVLNKYAKNLPNASGQAYATGTHWSGAFVSHIMNYADSSFPKSGRHINYITDAANGKSGYEAFPLKSGLQIKPEVGDILCYGRNGGSGDSHCDIIYKIDGHKAYLIGGNLGDTVETTEHNNYPIAIEIGDGTEANGKAYYKDLIWKSGEYDVLLKKTDNKYFSKAKIVGGSSGNNGVGSQDVEERMIIIAKFLKNTSKLTKYQLAGVLGNMRVETGDIPFSPLSINKKDGATIDCGIIHWNSGNFVGAGKEDCALGSSNWQKAQACVLIQIGDTVEKQLDYLENFTVKYPKFKKNSKNMTNTDDITHSFAKIVEVCTGCTGSKATFLATSGGKKRAEHAKTFLARLENASDTLYYNNL